MYTVKTVLSSQLKIAITKVLMDKRALWLSGRVLDSRPKGRGFEPHWRHCDVSLGKNINPSLVLVQPRKANPLEHSAILLTCIML